VKVSGNVWLAAVAGALFPLGLAPLDYWIASFVAVALLFTCLADIQPRRAALVGWAFGVGKYGVGASWIYVSIHDYGPAPMWLAGALVAVFVAAMALFPAACAAFYARFVRSRVGYASAISFSACWVALEWILTWFLTGFPWLFLGYAQLGNPLRHFAPVGGVLLVSFVAALSAAAMAVVLRQQRWPHRLLGAALVLAPWLAGALLAPVHWVQVGEQASVALVQGNIEQDVKWRPESVAPILDRYRELSAPYWHRDLVIWPEAAVTLFVHQAGAFLAEMDQRAREGGAALVLGVPAYEQLPDGSGAFGNTAIVLGNGEGRYVKRRLVPFGEYVPLEGLLRGAIEFFDLPMSHAAAGRMQQPLLVAGGHRLAMAICYEIAYPDLVRADARTADVIVTISNDSWFGHSIGPLQHLQMARMRALENGRYLLRATNNGVTAIVSEDGVVRAVIPQFTAGVLDGSFRPTTGITPYGRWGDMPALVCVLLGLLIGAAARRFVV
jgi:apolipoprotein N-acyltransferase